MLRHKPRVSLLEDDISLKMRIISLHSIVLKDNKLTGGLKFALWNDFFR